MRTSHYLFLPCAVLGAVSLWARSDDTSVATIASLNAQILRSPQGHDAESSLRERFPWLSALIRSNPGRALLLAFSDETIARLRSAASSPDAQLESRGRWEGMAFPLVVDSRDLHHSRTYLRMHSSEGDLSIYPGQGSAAIPPGARRYRVEGVRAGKNVAAANIVPLDPAASADTCSTTGVQKTIAFLVKIPGSPDPVFTVAQVQDWLFGTGIRRRSGFRLSSEQIEPVGFRELRKQLGNDAKGNSHRQGKA
jgi:hypothetical protein